MAEKSRRSARPQARWIVGCLLAALLLAAGGCGKAGPRYEQVFSAGPMHVKLRCDLDKQGAIIPQGLQHPFAIPPEQLKRVLEQVEFEEYAFFKWRERGRAFYDEELIVLAEPLSQALGRANPDQVVVFQSGAKKRDLLLPTQRLTTGLLFVREGRLNLVLGNLNWEQMDAEDEFYADDPRERALLSPYRMKTAAGIEIPARVPGDRQLAREHQNWLLLDTAALLAEPERAPADAVESDAEQRLRALQELLDKGLITQEEYERKRQEILDSL